MMKNLQKFRHWQTSESALRFMNGLTLVCLVVWIFMLWFIDIFSYHHLQSCTYIDQCTFIRAEFSPVTPNKFIWAYQNRKIVLDLGSILYWVVRKFTKAAMNVKWSSVDIRKSWSTRKLLTYLLAISCFQTDYVIDVIALYMYLIKTLGIDPFSRGVIGSKPSLKILKDMF